MAQTSDSVTAMRRMAPKAQRFAPGPPPEDALDSGDYEPTAALMQWADEVKRVAQQEWQLQASSALVDFPLQVIFAALYAQYNNDVQTLIQRAGTAGENSRLSRVLGEAFARRNWSVATARKYATVVKRILGLLSLPDGFVSSLRLVCVKRAVCSKALGKYGKLPTDDPARVRVESWIEALRDGTRNSSDLSLRNVIQFYGNVCLPALGLELRSWPADAAAHVRAWLQAKPDTLRTIVGQGASACVKASRLQFLLKDICGVDVDVPVPKKRHLSAVGEDEGNDGHDVHRISPEHLELLHVESKKTLRDEVLFVLMLTTGLRVGGVTKIVTRNVAEVKNGQFIIKPTGKTKEKGNKFASFVIGPQLRDVLARWLAYGRPADDGPYLFPGQQRGCHLSTETIRASFAQLCRNCNIEGPQCHPHALRHTHAHMLLECGNSAETVSKCLNHSSVDTTQKFYLRESAAEVQGRCRMPWMKMETDAEKEQRALSALPAFLQPQAAPSRKPALPPGITAEKLSRRQANKEMMMQFTGRAPPSTGSSGIGALPQE